MTPKQERFVSEYLIDLNATQAAIRAGYSPKAATQVASRLLTNANVQLGLAKAREALTEKAAVTAEMVIAELAKIGFADIRRAVKWGATFVVPTLDRAGNELEAAHTPMALIASDEIDEATAAAISEVSIGKDGQMKVKMHDKRAALVDLGRHLGMFETEKAPEAKGLEVVFNQFNVSVEDSRAQFRKLLEHGLSRGSAVDA